MECDDADQLKHVCKNIRIKIKHHKSVMQKIVAMS